jgi:hypothetical protein
MISRFYVNLTFAHTVDCRVVGWRDTGEPTLAYIERVEVDGEQPDREYTNQLLQMHSTIYRELERKLGLPRYSLKYRPFVSEQSS